MQQKEYSNMEQDSFYYSQGYDDGYYHGKIEGRREAFDEVRELLKGLTNDR